MRILIHGLNFAPELVGVGKYTGEMAEWLAARGHEVRAVVAPPFHPQWKVAAGFSPWRYSSEARFGRSGEAGEPLAAPRGRLRVFRSPLWVPPEPSGAKRVLHLASFALASLPAMLWQGGWRPEVVLAVEPTLFCLPAAWMTARLCRAKTWLHVQDFEADAGFELGLVPFRGMRRLVEWGEKNLLSAFGMVSTISEKMLARLEQKGIARSACRLFPNWVDTNAIFPLPKPSPLRAELGISPGEVVALYAGTMAHKQGLEVLGEAAERLAERGRAGNGNGSRNGNGKRNGKAKAKARERETKEIETEDRETEEKKSVRLVFCGEGPGKEALAARTSTLANVQWIPLQPMERLNDLLNLADIHLLPQKADAADLVMPSKLTGMLASGRPVVATSRSGTQLAQAVEDRGIVVEPGDARALANAVEQLAGDPRGRQRLGHNAREYALGTLEKESVLARFEQELIEFAARD